MPVSADTGLIRRIRAGTPLPAKDLRKKPPFFGIASNALMYTLSHFWRNGRVHISAISEINFRNACWGTSPNPSKMPQGHFVKTLWKTGRLSQKFCAEKNLPPEIFYSCFYCQKLNKSMRKNFVSWKILRHVFRCVIVNAKEQPPTKWLTSQFGKSLPASGQDYKVGFFIFAYYSYLYR